MIRAVAIGSVIEGDKADKAKTDMLNEDCAVDVAELIGWGATMPQVAMRSFLRGARRMHSTGGRLTRLRDGAVYSNGWDAGRARDWCRRRVC